MRIMSILCAICLSLALSACGEATVDASSLDALEKSLTTLSVETGVDRDKLEAAVEHIAFDEGYRGRGMHRADDSFAALVSDRIDGMTAAELIDEARRVN